MRPQTPIDIALKTAAGLLAIAFVVLGLAWWIVPGFASAQLGMPLLDGLGLSSQIGDVGSFFLTLGACVLTGLLTGKRHWLYPAIMLLAFANLGRLLAFAVHGASLASQMIGVEWVALFVLFLNVRRLKAY